MERAIDRVLDRQMHNIAQQRIVGRLSGDMGKARGEERGTDDERGKSLRDRALETKDRLRGDAPGTAKAREMDRWRDFDR